MPDETPAAEDSGVNNDDTLLGQERDESADEQQSVDNDANESSEQENHSEHNDAVTEKRLRDTQAKVTELAEQLKAATAQLDGLKQRDEEPFDEEKFIDDFVGGEEAYERFRDDPGLLAKELTKRFLHHQAQVLVDRDRYWESKFDDLVNKLETSKPEFAEYAKEIQEIESQFDIKGMSQSDKIKLAKMIRAKGSGPSKAIPPGPKPGRREEPKKKSFAPPGYLESLGIGDTNKANNTLL